MADVLTNVALSAVAIPESIDFETFFHGEYPQLCRSLVLLVGDAFEAEELPRRR